MLFVSGSCVLRFVVDCCWLYVVSIWLLVVGCWLLFVVCCLLLIVCSLIFFCDIC